MKRFTPVQRVLLLLWVITMTPVVIFLISQVNYTPNLFQ